MRLGVPIECGRTFDIQDAPGSQVLFAGDLRDVVETRLEHRGVYLVYLAFPVSAIGRHETYYSPDPRYWFGRVSELKHYSPELSNANETILCIEIPEGAWGRGLDFSNGDRLAAVLEQLCNVGLLQPGMVPIEHRQIFVPNVYPIYRRGFRAEWRKAMGRVAEMGSVIPFGRQALFLHCNLDHCAEIAASAVEHVLAGRSTHEWVAQAEGYLELRVRD
jgi:hypothetical protein